MQRWPSMLISMEPHLDSSSSFSVQCLLIGPVKFHNNNSLNLWHGFPWKDSELFIFPKYGFPALFYHTDGQRIIKNEKLTAKTLQQMMICSYWKSNWHYSCSIRRKNLKYLHIVKTQTFHFCQRNETMQTLESLPVPPPALPKCNFSTCVPCIITCCPWHLSGKRREQVEKRPG